MFSLETEGICKKTEEFLVSNITFFLHNCSETASSFVLQRSKLPAWLIKEH